MTPVLHRSHHCFSLPVAPAPAASQGAPSAQSPACSSRPSHATHPQSPHLLLSTPRLNQHYYAPLFTRALRPRASSPPQPRLPPLMYPFLSQVALEHLWPSTDPRPAYRFAIPYPFSCQPAARAANTTFSKDAGLCTARERANDRTVLK